MTWVVPLALGGLAILVMAVFTAVGSRRRLKAQVAPAKVVGPAVLIHDINDDRCTGCDACVAVCPTNVLDLVSNKSRVLRFQDCIQCEACMYACPTEALVMFPEGATPPPLKCPEIDENFQTIVAGQYLIGEVAGKPLVKSAANLGRMVVEHMLTTGMRVGALGKSDTTVDVVIVGSGPGGLSAALTCVQRGLSYVVLEKEQTIASTIMRYPKGKLVMAEPYDTLNLSLLPVFDSSKEALIPIWQELLERVGVNVKLGESVETIARGGDGVFETKTTVGSYRSQRVVLSIGTRGKPRTLQVPGENLPKIFSLLEDPDAWNGRAVLVVGGGDSAVEAALALADAGARVMISYRGKGFNRAAAKNKQAIERYAAEGRLKAKLGSQVLQFDQDTVTLALADGAQKKYPNDGTFVLIGADPPVAWLEKMGVKFIERPHQYQTGKTDDLVRRLVPKAIECPEDAARAAAQVLGGTVGPAPAKKMPTAAQAVMMPMMPMGDPVSGPRKWLRSATSIFSMQRSGKLGTNPGVESRVERAGAPLTNAPAPASQDPVAGGGERGASRKKKFDAPVPLSEFAKRQRSSVNHSGNGRRDQLSAGERTRILRMLRDEGGRMADEDSQVFIGAAPPAPNDPFDFDDSPAPAPANKTGASGMSPTPVRGDIPAKPAVVVGLAQAKARSKRSSERPAIQPGVARPARRSVPPPDPDVIASSSASARRLPLQADAGGPQVPTGRRSPLPPPFLEEPTRQVDDALLAKLRAEAPGSAGAPMTLDRARPSAPVTLDPFDLDESTRPGPDLAPSQAPLHLTDAMLNSLEADTMPPARRGAVEDHSAHEEATRMASLDGIAALERANHASQQGMPAARSEGSPPPRAAARKKPPTRQQPMPAVIPQAPSQDPSSGNEERTRAVDIRHDKSISDIDWDLD